jgi:hypothetical protein
LYGSPDSEYVCAELERRISDALLADARIVGVSDFDFTVRKSPGAGTVVHAMFTVTTADAGFRVNENINIYEENGGESNARQYDV